MESGVYLIGVNNPEQWRLLAKGGENVWKMVGTDVKKSAWCVFFGRNKDG